MNLLLGKANASASSKSTETQARPARPKAEFFNKVEAATLSSCMEMARKVATREWIIADDGARIIKMRGAGYQDKGSLMSEAEYLERSAKTLEFVQQAAFAVREGKLLAVVEKIQTDAEASTLARSAERFARLAAGAVLEVPPEKENEHALKVSLSWAAAMALGGIFAAFPNPISGAGLALALGTFAKSLRDAYLWTNRHLNAKFMSLNVEFGKSKSTGYLFLDRLARLSEENLGKFVLEIDKIRAEVDAKLEKVRSQLSKPDVARNGFALIESTLKAISCAKSVAGTFLPPENLSGQDMGEMDIPAMHKAAA